jgi:hypothetical protein
MPPPTSIIQRSFAAGELAPSLHARADLSLYGTGARLIRNFVVRKEGGVSNRAGYRFVSEVKDSSKEVILMRYVGADLGTSVLIEMGDGFFRFYQDDALVTVSGVSGWDGMTDYVPGDVVSDSGTNYYCIKANTNQEPPNATYWYAMPADDILELPHHFGVHKPMWDQQGTKIALTHGEAAPADLIFEGLTRWVLRVVATGPWAPPPTSVTFTPGTPGPSGGHTYAYVVTAAREVTYEETEASTASLSDGSIQAGIGEPTKLLPNALTWDAVSGAAEYYVYCDPYQNGVYGFIGTAQTNAFFDTGFVPDFGLTPPIERTLFASSGEYPNCSGTFEQRRVFANSANTPDQVDLSRTAFPDNFGIASPLQDDDAIRFKLAGSSNHPVEWIVGHESLIIGTSAGVWRVQGGGGSALSAAGALTPDSIDAKQSIFNGVADKKPALVGKNVVYIGARQRIIRETHLDANVQGLDGRDLTVYATHLFEPTTVYHLDYAEQPHSIVWVVRNDGVLLGLTYLPETEMVAWHQHTTQNGVFEDVCVIPDGDEDAVYVVVKRDIGGTKRYIERLASRIILDFNEDAFFVDSGLSYSGSPTDTFTGLEHLEGQVVAVLGDGTVLFNGDPDGDAAATFTVSGGSIGPLDAEYTDVHIGLPIRFPDLETLDLDVQGSEIRDHKKRVGSVTLLLDKSSRGFLAGADADHLTDDVAQSWEGSITEYSGPVEVPLDANFNPNGRVFIRQPNPLPITILGIIPNVEVGG